MDRRATAAWKAVGTIKCGNRVLNSPPICGGLAEWTKASVSKTEVPLIEGDRRFESYAHRHFFAPI